MLSVKSSSTSKSEAKCTQLIRMTEYSTPIQNSVPRKDYIRSQPIKIAQLLREEENLKRVQKDCVRKKVQPERLGQLSNTKITRLPEKQDDYERSQPIKIAKLFEEEENLKRAQKSTVRKKVQSERLGQLSSIRNTRLKEKHDGINTCDQPVRSEKRVRRNLNFNEVSGNVLKHNNEIKNKSNKLTNNEPNSKEVFNKMNRTSLLLPPNSIKHKHLQNCIRETNKYSKMSQVSKEIESTDKKCDSRIYFTIQEEKKLENNNSLLLNNVSPSKNGNTSAEFECIKTSNGCKTVEVSNHSSLNVNTNHAQCSEIPHVTKILPPSECTTHQQVAVNYEDQSCVQNNSLHEIFIPNKINSKNEISGKPKDQCECIENLCNNFQDTNITVSENNINARCTSSEMIYIDRNKLIHLECKLKDLLRVTEENASTLKSTLTCVTNLLSTKNEKVTKSNVYIKNQEHPESGKVHNMMLDKEVQVGICCNLMQQSEENLKTPTLGVPDITVNSVKHKKASELNQSDKNNKENHETMNEKNTCDGTDESFLNLENQLNITHANFTQDHCTQQKTPTIAKYSQKRSLREYMALKSSMSFLETPDGKRFRSLCQKKNIDTSVLSRTYISNKVLTDIHNLYSDSPESD